ncbi:amidohydrolase family protein [Eudoraea adriatica]|uniref:amidohydrolase family protein n=1 Tax=Eudoraea adriatica TaxID=446681 RepID=UPI00037665D7|nr:amidohydrolase family protein [Eudoraea adriatica]
MIKTVTFLVLAIFFVSCNSKLGHRNADYIIQNVKMFDGDDVYSNSTIIIHNGNIQKIYTSQNTSFSGENVIDGRGLMVIPGLIDAHVHLETIKQGKEAVKAGILTVLDMAHFSDSIIPSIKALRKLGDSLNYLPYFYSAGNPVTVPNGHGLQFHPYKTVSTVDELPSFIKKRVNEGSDFIKIIIERQGGKLSIITNEMIGTSIRLANDHDLMAVAHISERSYAIEASRMGIDGLCHFWYKNFKYGDTSKISKEELDILINNQVFVIPTISIWKQIGERWGAFDIESMKEEIGKVHEAGIPILAGTDAPGFDMNFGAVLHEEMQYLSECGISNLDVLKTATSNVSKAFGLGGKGFVKEGGSADLLLIDGDPTEDISTISEIIGIWKKGVKVKQ